MTDGAPTSPVDASSWYVDASTDHPVTEASDASPDAPVNPCEDLCSPGGIDCNPQAPYVNAWGCVNACSPVSKVCVYEGGSATGKSWYCCR